ncbi:MAG: hypothetical protein IT223_09290 [Crocinitomicaceae bacterium]|nr:hypothetical protein [Crocinitomicaceae bacterium]
MKYRALIFFSSGIFVLSACNKKRGEGYIVARVGTKELTWAQLKEVIPDNSSPGDSVQLAERYITDWVREQAVLIQAEENLAEEKKDFEGRIENYRKSLLIYTYEQEWVRQKLDTNVS